MKPALPKKLGQADQHREGVPSRLFDFQFQPPPICQHGRKAVFELKLLERTDFELVDEHSVLQHIVLQ